MYQREFFIYDVDITNPGEWTHIVMNYIGPNRTQGIRAYTNGAFTSKDMYYSTLIRSAGDGHVVIGRQFTKEAKSYADYPTVDLDELMLFNHILTEEQIAELYEVNLLLEV